MLRPSFLGPLSVAVLLSQPSGAFAAPPVAPPSDRAQALFDRGVADMEAGKFEKACPAIEASQRLEPMPGTLFALAECEAQRGRLATAMRYYGEYLALYRAFSAKKKAEQKDRATTSEEQLRKLSALVPRLTLKLPGGAGPDVVVKRNGEVVADLSLGVPLAVDPGEHVITTQAPGGPEIAERVSLAVGDAKTFHLRVQREPAPKAAAQSDPLAAPVPAPTPPDLRWWRAGTVSAGAVGLIGFTVGVVAGILALEQKGVVDRHCTPDGAEKKCSPAGLEARNRVAALGDASTTGFVLGSIGVSVGVGLWIATPSLPRDAGGVGQKPPTGAQLPPLSISMSGTF